MTGERTNFYREISSNKYRSFFLMFVFALVVIAIGYFLGAAWGNPYFGFAIAFAFSFISAFVSYYWSDKIVLAMSNAQQVEEQDFPQLYHVVEEMSIAAGLPMPRVYVIDDPAPNAFATGRNPEHAVVAATTGLLQMTTRDELEGVIAHEMSHVRNYDILFQTLAVVMAGMVVLMSDWLLRSFFWGGGRRRNDREGGGQLALVLMVVGIIFAILAPIFANLLRLAISRKREYMADASGVQLTRYPEGLASALGKLASYSHPMQSANRATAPLFIVNPFSAKGMSSLLSTHPPIEERIRRLREMEVGTDPNAPLPKQR
jgi:heat shock protein HtpX